jgi:hypothetical protein
LSAESLPNIHSCFIYKINPFLLDLEEESKAAPTGIMKKVLFILFSVLISFASCDKTQKKPQAKVAVKTNSIKQDTSSPKNESGEAQKTIPKNIKPIFGYRFIISGDFDGDGKKEQLIEHYFSRITNKESNKFYDGISDQGELVDLTVKKQPYSFALSDNKAIDTLHIAEQSQLLGLSYLKNEGDLNGDGTDEVSYVVDWADWSSLNTWHIMTYKNKKWREVYKFDIWDWQLPDLPETFSQFGLFGLEKRATVTNDTVNKRLEKELKSFDGLVKKIKHNKIQVIYRNYKGEEDTLVVDLKRVKQK